MAEALDYAHHQGVVHRDVKPANVLLTSSDVPKLSDFGLSMIAFTDQGEHSGVVRGTPHYMSPEQTRGSRLDYRTDLYSLGVMIYESATGSVPFTGPSVSIMSQHYSAVPDRPRSRNPQVSHELEALILSLLAKRPGDRPGSGSRRGAGTARGGRAIERKDKAPGPAGPASMTGDDRLDGPLADRTACPPESARQPTGRPHRPFASTVGPESLASVPPSRSTPMWPHRFPRWRRPMSAGVATSTGGRLTRATRRGQRRRNWRHARVGPLAAGTAHARASSGRADPAHAGGTLPARPLSGLPLERIPPPRLVPAPAPGTPQRRPRHGYYWP